MIDLETQKTVIDIHHQVTWIIKVIDSCFTEEQLHSARFLITLFIGQLAIKGLPLKNIKETEDALLEKYIQKEAII